MAHTVSVRGWKGRLKGWERPIYDILQATIHKDIEIHSLTHTHRLNFNTYIDMGGEKGNHSDYYLGKEISFPIYNK